MLIFLWLALMYFGIGVFVLLDFDRQLKKHGQSLRWVYDRGADPNKDYRAMTFRKFFIVSFLIWPWVLVVRKAFLDEVKWLDGGK